MYNKSNRAVIQTKLIILQSEYFLYIYFLFSFYIYKYLIITLIIIHSYILLLNA